MGKEKERRKRQLELDQLRMIGQVQKKVRALGPGKEQGQGMEESTQEAIDLLNSNLDGVKSTSVAREDAQVFQEVSRRYTDAVKDGARWSRRIDAGQLTSRLKSAFAKEFADDDVGWRELGRMVGRYFNGIFGNGFLFNALEVKERKRPERRQKQKPAEDEPKLAPETIKNDEKSKKVDHHEQMQTLIFKKLKEEGPQNMLKFLINPHSFTQTVENFFEYSFLVDNYSCIEVDGEGNPQVSVPKGWDGSSDVSSSMPRKSSILSFTMDDWKTAVETLKIKESMIPDRMDPIYKNSS